MIKTNTITYVDIFKRYLSPAGLIVALSGIVVLLGWQFNITFFKSISPLLPSVNPVTAICFVLLGFSFVLHNQKGQYILLLADVCSVLVLVIAFCRLSYLFEFNLINPDEILFSDKLGSAHMAIASAFNLLFLSIAQLTLRQKESIVRLAMVFSALGISSLSLIGYIFFPWKIINVPFFASMSLVDSFLFIILSVGMFSFDLEHGFMKVLSSQGIAGVIVRKILPRTILTLFILSWLRLKGEQLGYYDFDTGMFFLLAANIIIFVLIIWNVGEEIEGLDHDRQEQYQAFLEKSTRLNIATKSAKMGVWEWNFKSNEKIWDEQMFALYGHAYSSTANPIKVWEETVHPQDLARVQQELRLAIDGKKEYDTEFRVVWPDKSTHYIKAHGQVLCDVFGVPVKMIGVNWDITELRHNANALRDQKLALDQHAIVAITDTKGKITYVNDKFCEISKYSRDELMGKDHRIVNSGYHSKSFFKDFWDTISSGHVWRGEIKNKAKDGSYYWVFATIVPFLDQDGKPYQYLAIRADITALKTAEQQLLDQKIKIEKVAQELVRSNADLEQFAYVASHDLQEPLRMVASFTQLLEKKYKDKLDDRAKEYIFFAVDGAKRMQGLIDDLLMFSRAGNRDVFKMPVDLNVLCGVVKKDLDALIVENKAVVNVGALPTVFANETQMNQLFLNLIGNAIKYRSEQDPIINVSAQQLSAREWAFAIADNGIGIEKKYFEKLFVIFQRLHTRKNYKGTGIGLALCKKIVENYGGRIWVESELGKGSTFRFILNTGERVANEAS